VDGKGPRESEYILQKQLQEWALKNLRFLAGKTGKRRGGALVVTGENFNLGRTGRFGRGKASGRKGRINWRGRNRLGGIRNLSKEDGERTCDGGG